MIIWQFAIGVKRKIAGVFIRLQFWAGVRLSSRAGNLVCREFEVWLGPPTLQTLTRIDLTTLDRHPYDEISDIFQAGSLADPPVALPCNIQSAFSRLVFHYD
jgi:hypothetical protein